MSGTETFIPATAGPDSSAAADSAAGDAAADHDAQRDDESNPEQNTEGDAAHSDHDKTLRKLQRRIDNRTRALGQRDQEIAQLRQQLHQGSQRQADPGNDDDKGAQHSGADVETRAREIAREALAGEKVADKTRSMLKAGEALDPQFTTIALEVAEEIPFIDERGRPTEFIKLVLDTDAPAQLLYHLGKNPDLVADLADLSPTQQARRLAKLEIEIAKAPPKRSAASKPLAPVAGGGSNSKDESAMSDDEWRANRLKRG